MKKIKFILTSFLAVIIFIASVGFANVNEEKTKHYPVVVIGGGVGGLSSGVYLARAGHTPLIIEGQNPSAITLSEDVKNWPGEKNISGLNLIEKLKDQATENGCDLMPGQVLSVDFSKLPYKIVVRNIFESKDSVITAGSVIIATGQSAKKLNVEGEAGLLGNGISTCALCDGGFYKDQTVAVIGGSDSAIVEANYLANLAKKVYVVLRGKDFRSTCDQKRKNVMLSKDNIEILYSKAIDKIISKDDEISHLVLENAIDHSKQDLDVDGIFLAIGSRPNSDIFKGQLELDDSGYIILKNGQETSVPKVFAVGDVVASDKKQAIIASSMGALAAIETQKYIEENNSVRKALALEHKKEIFPDKLIEVHSVAEFEKEIVNSSLPILVDFYASWCGPCKRITPFLHESAKTLSGKVKILKVNVTTLREIADKYNIRAMPTLIVFDSEGKKVVSKKGSDQIVTFINSIKGIESQNIDQFISELYQ